MAAESFVGVRIQGGLLPAEFLSRISAGALSGQASADYHLAAGETVREAANRSWAYLTGVWSGYRQAAAKLPEGDRGTTLTRERWLLILLRELDFGRVPATPAGGLASGDKEFPVSHVWEHVPIHLLGHTIDLDRRTQGVAGAASSSPQSMVQELLNRSDSHLWALLSNGLTLRLLRDSTSLVGSAYVEFDLEAIFDGELFADFLLLYSICHQSRLEVREPEKGAASCWVEAWRTESVESGSRALNQLRDGVVNAITTLGTGFLAHAANGRLRDGLADGSLREADINHGLLRIVYRLLFTFVAEDRGLLLDPAASVPTRERYRDYFSTARLRRTARRRRGTRHTDQWRALNLVWDGLGSIDGRPELGLVGIGGLFEPGALDLFHDCELTNEALLTAVRHLSLVTEPGSGVRRVVDYRNLGAEELGSIYEALLEFVPSWNPEKRAFELLSAAGNDRKSTGSYYTPTSLIDCLLDSALDPVLDRAEREDNPEEALLAITVCDPACGSGHFLVAAARRIAKRVAAIRTGDPEPPPERVREAMGDVVGRCLYGVDLNPLAAELAKVSLWLETLDPGRPLAFLDAQIKVGNSLIGATPALVVDGVPNEAFTALEGDDKQITSALKRRNDQELAGQDDLFGDPGTSVGTHLAAQLSELLGSGRAASLADVHARAQRLKALDADPSLQRQRLVADAWCAAFVWPKLAGAPKAVTDRSLRALERGETLTPDTMATIHDLAAQYRFFHWHLEFPHVFRAGGDHDGAGWAGGFDVVLGNPPWEHVELKEQEFFAVREPGIALATGAHRKRLIDALPRTNPPLAEAFASEKRHIDGSRHFLSASGRYPLCGRGRIKTDPVFAELGRSLIQPRGRFGMVLPTGIATDATTQFFFKDLVRKGSLVSLHDFENRKPLFDGVDSRYKFCLLTLAGRGQREARAEFAFFAHDPTDLLKDNARFELTPEEIQLLNPNTGTCPIFRSRRDAEITLGIYRRVPILINENDPVNGNPWGVRFMQGLFNMTSDSHLFHTREELEADGWKLNGNVFGRPSEHADLVGSLTSRMLPLYEAKMIHQFDHRWATYQDGSVRDVVLPEKQDPSFVALPRYWVREEAVNDRLGSDPVLMGIRDITNSTNERTVISALFPRSAVGNNLPVMLDIEPRRRLRLVACLSSFALDFIARPKVGGVHLNFFIANQLAVLPPEQLEGPGSWCEDLGAWIDNRVLRLASSARDLADALDKPICQYDPSERTFLKAELDAAMFHLYGTPRADVDYIMDTFPIVKRKDEAAFGSYRTKELILDVYDAMQAAIDSGGHYLSPFDDLLAQDTRPGRSTP